MQIFSKFETQKPKMSCDGPYQSDCVGAMCMKLQTTSFAALHRAISQSPSSLLERKKHRPEWS